MATQVDTSMDRAALAEWAGVSAGTVKWWVRTGLLSGARERTNSPTRFSGRELLVARALAASHQLGPDQDLLRRVADRIREIRVPAQGWLIVTPRGEVTVAYDDEDLARRLRLDDSPALVIQMPDDT